MGFIEKSISFGLGLFSYSKEKIEEIVEELVNKGEIAKNEAKQFANELIQKGQEQREELSKMIKDEVTSTLDKLNVAKKEDIISSEEIAKIVREQLLEVLKEKGIINE